MTGLEFERHCAKLLRKSGYTNVKVTKASGDQGVDIIASLGGYKYAIQCKKYKNPVGNKAIQEVYAGMQYHNCDFAMVMTNSTFTKSAKALAESTGVELWENVSINEASAKSGCLFWLVLCLIYGAIEFMKTHPILSILIIIVIIVLVVLAIKLILFDANMKEEKRTEFLEDDTFDETAFYDEKMCEDKIEPDTNSDFVNPNIEENRIIIDENDNENPENSISKLADEVNSDGENKMNKDILEALKAIVPVDELLHDSAEIVVLAGNASASALQRRFKIGYNRASQLIDTLESVHIIGPSEGVRPRCVYITENEWDAIQEEFNVICNSKEKYDIEQISEEEVIISLDDKNMGDELKRENSVIIEQYDKSKYKFLRNLGHLIIEFAQDNSVSDFQDTLASTYNKNEIKYIFIDKTRLYRNPESLLIPVIFEENKIPVAFDWLKAEMMDRYAKLAKNKTADLDTYNEQVPLKDRAPDIFVVVTEMYDFPEIEGKLKETLIDVLLKGNRVGIHCLFSSKFKAKTLNLSEEKELLRTVHSNSLNALVMKLMTDTIS